MSKNEKTLSVGDIEKRKKELESDLEKIQNQIQTQKAIGLAGI